MTISVLMSAYRFDPYGVSESYSGFKWAEILAATFDLTVCTPVQGRTQIERYLTENPGSPLQRATFRFVEMPSVDARLGAVGSALKPGFFLYESLLLRQLRRTGDSKRYSVIMHRTPVSFRFRTRLGSLGVPLVVGPISGGLHPPRVLASFFGAEPLLYRLRGLDRWLLGSEWWMRPLRHASQVLISSEYVRGLLPEPVASRARVLLETGIDCASVTPADPSNGGRFEVVFAGRLTRYKAPTLAVEAFGALIGQCDEACDARLTMIGDGEERAECEAIASRLGIADKVRFTGWLDKPSALLLMREADVFLFPSVTEAAGNVYLEAMALGLPSVIVDFGGGHDIVPEAAAVKVPVATETEIVNGLAAGLRALHDDPGLRASMGAQARAHVCEHYDWSVLEMRAVRIVEEAAGEGRRR